MGDYCHGLGTHAGSVWLAYWLDGPEEGVSVVNEAVGKCLTEHWMSTLKRQVDKGHLDVNDPAYAKYFEMADQKLEQYRIYCDFNSFAPCFLPDLDKRLPIKRIIAIVRNGIQQFYSLVNSYIWSRLTEDHWLVDQLLRLMWEFGGSQGKSFDQRTFWEKQCIQWTAHPRQYRKLEEMGYPIEIYRLEDLTTKPEVLMQLIQSFVPLRNYPERVLKVMQQKDINRKVNLDRTPLNLWRQWSQEQQEGFIEVCGDEMIRYEYEIPEVGG